MGAVDSSALHNVEVVVFISSPPKPHADNRQAIKIDRSAVRFNIIPSRGLLFLLYQRTPMLTTNLTNLTTAEKSVYLDGNSLQGRV